MSGFKFNNYKRLAVAHPCAPDCPDRKALCSVTCEKWAAYVEKRNAAYAERLKRSERMAGTSAYLREAARKPYLKKKDPKMHQ